MKLIELFADKWCMNEFYKWLCPLLADDTFIDKLDSNRNLILNVLDKLLQRVKQ